MVIKTSSELNNSMTRSQKIVLTIVVLGIMMTAIDVTIVLLAIPTITSSLHTNLSSSMWIITGYLLVLAILTTQFGRIGDIYGRGKMFNLGFLVFVIGSALAGLSIDISMLIISRLVQAVGGALIESNSSAVISDIFPAKIRGKAFGYTSLGFNLGAMLGIVLGGVFTTFFGWSFIFYINVPIGIIAFILGIKYIKDPVRTKEKLDIRGMLILTGILVFITIGATNISSIGFTLINETLLITGFILILLFYIVEKKIKFPTIDFAIFKNKILAYSLFASFFESMGYLAVAFLVIMYLQGVRGLTPFDAALLLVPGYIIGGIFSPYIGKLLDRVGARILSTLGIIVIIISVLIYLTIGPNTSYYIIIIASSISGLGASLFYPSNTKAVMTNIIKKRFGITSGILITMQNIGALFSFVVAITIASITIPREIAYKILVGTVNLTNNISSDFIVGLHYAFIVSIIILIISVIFSFKTNKKSNHLYKH